MREYLIFSFDLLNGHVISITNLVKNVNSLELKSKRAFITEKKSLIDSLSKWAGIVYKISSLFFLVFFFFFMQFYQKMESYI